MMNAIDIADWNPADGFELEAEALNTVMENANTLVVAGPGAGKTELLAQRASFLLETNTCKYPRKILAISFKKDAAANLKERVELRCGKVLSLRFESKTYDAFAKEILDRFVESIHEDYRPTKGYKIAEMIDLRNAFNNSGLKFKGTYNDFKRIYANRLSLHKLPLSNDFVDQIFIDTWKTLLKGNGKDNHQCYLTFEMISRLAEYLIRTNIYIKRSIERTYSHVFLDEFQDTTTIQYELIKTCFCNTKSIVTAVGDNKQRIMVWAGARKTIFDDFINEFSSGKRTLLMNHRSAPKLVEIQKAMYNRLNEENISVVANKKWKSDDGEAFLRLFDNHIQEAEIISDEIYKLFESGILLSNICILVKQKVDVYGDEIIKQLAKYNIKARNEALYQDLINEDIVKILISLYKLAANDCQPDAWNYFYEVMSDINGIESDCSKDRNADFINQLSSIIEKTTINLDYRDKTHFNNSIDEILKDITYERLASKFKQYQSRDYFENLSNTFKELLWDEFIQVENWTKAIENFEGKNSIPIMTVHKSKGLEFDTIFFVGLEDSAFLEF